MIARVRWNPTRLQRLLNALETAHFECGEWDGNESDESYDRVHARACRAEDRVIRYVTALATQPCHRG
jgi:hypothetical protein